MISKRRSQSGKWAFKAERIAPISGSSLDTVITGIAAQRSQQSFLAGRACPFQRFQHGIAGLFTHGLQAFLQHRLLAEQLDAVVGANYPTIYERAYAGMQRRARQSAGLIGLAGQYAAVATTKFAQFQDIISAQLDLAFNGSISMEEACAAIDKKANAEVFNN